MPGLRLIALLTFCLGVIVSAHAQISGDKVRIGVLTDLSGVYEQHPARARSKRAKMAAEEFGGKVNGKPIEILCRRSSE